MSDIELHFADAETGRVVRIYGITDASRSLRGVLSRHRASARWVDADRCLELFKVTSRGGIPEV